jgi:hypothetical protein
LKPNFVDSTEAADGLAAEVRALKSLSTRELQERFAVLHGYESRSNNYEYLWKRTAWKLQEMAEGGLSDEVKARALALAKESDLRAHPPRRALAAAITESVGSQRDPRLPPIGSVLRREHGGEVHEVTVRSDGFEYRGATFKSLSRVARVITGAAWNGFVWFGLAARKRGRACR